MEKKLIYLPVFVFLVELGSTNNVLHLTVDSSACSNYYDLEDYTEAYLTYKGAALGEEECYVKFTNWDAFQQTQCIKPQNMQLSCPNTVDVYRHFISSLSPERQFTCTASPTMYDEWCGSVRTTYLYIVFRTNGGTTYSNNVKLHIYRKPLPKDDDPWDSDTSSSTAIYIAVVVPLVIFVTIIMIVVIVFVIVRRSRARRPQFYNTSAGQAYMQTASVPMQPINQQQQPSQHQQTPSQQPPGNYQWHPMQTAYPVTAGQNATPPMSNQMGQQRYTPPAPPDDETAPPSYESVVS